MRYTIVSIIVCGVFASALSAADKAPAASEGILSVEVVNGTDNGTPVTGDEVIVHIYKQGELHQSLEGRVGEDGKAIFEGVPTGDRVIAVARSKHNEMMFTAPPVALASPEGQHVARVQVFDNSDDSSALSVKTHHLIMRSTAGALAVTEYMQLVNSSSMAVSSAREDAEGRTIVLSVNLPRGFRDLKCQNYFEEHALVVTEEGFYDTMAVPPGVHQVTFSYNLDLASELTEIVKGITLPTAKLVIFGELGRSKLEGLGEPDNSGTTPDGAQMEYYTREGLLPGEQIAFRISHPGGASSGSRSWVILAVVFGLVMIPVILRMRSGRK